MQPVLNQVCIKWMFIHLCETEHDPQYADLKIRLIYMEAVQFKLTISNFKPLV